MNIYFIGSYVLTFASGFGSAWTKFRSDMLAKWIEACISSISEFRISAIDYWSIPGNDPKAGSLGANLSRQSKAIWTNLEALREDFTWYKPVKTQLLIELRKVATGGDFQGKSREADPARADRIAAAAEELIIAVRRSKPLVPFRLPWLSQ